MRRGPLAIQSLPGAPAELSLRTQRREVDPAGGGFGDGGWADLLDTFQISRIGACDERWRWLNGAVDDMRIYKHGLSEVEVMLLHNWKGH